MSRPRFLADNDLMDQIVLGVQRREPSVEFTRLRDAGLAKAADSDGMARFASCRCKATNALAVFPTLLASVATSLNL